MFRERAVVLLAIRSAPRRSAQSLWGLPEGSDKRPSHPLWIAKARRAGNAVDGLGAGFYPFARDFDPQPLHRAGGGQAGLGGKGAGEVAWAHGCAVSKPFNVQGFMQPFAHPAQQVREPAIGPIQLQQG